MRGNWIHKNALVLIIVDLVSSLEKIQDEEFFQEMHGLSYGAGYLSVLFQTGDNTSH